ncbi:MAG: copper resistance protein CopC [bacterium]
MIKLLLRRSIGRGLIMGGLVFVFALALSPAVSFGHAKLLRSQPAANAKLTQAPKTVELWFSEELEPSFSTIIVHDQNGKHVDKNNVNIADGGKKLQIDLEDLASGTYTVEWKALSTDQHTMKGKFGFTLAREESAASTSFATPSGAEASTEKQRPEPATTVSTVSESQSGTDWTMSFVRWLEYLAMMTLFGGFAFRLLVLRPTLRKAPELDDEQTAAALFLSRRRFVSLSWFSITLLTLGTLAALVLQTAAVLDLSVGQAFSLSPMSQVIRRTSYGRPWLLQLATLVIVAVVIFLISRHNRQKQPAEDNSGVASRTLLLWTGLGISALMFLSPSLTGHAAAAAKEWPLAVFSDWLHLVAAGFWVGGLFHLVLAMMRVTSELDGRQRLSVLHNVIPIFTRLAVVSTMLIAITGVYNSWIHIDRLNALWSTPYGKTLSIKVLFFIPMIALGGWNTFVIHRRAQRLVGRDDGKETSDHLKLDRTFRRSITIEATLGVAVLLAAAVLVFLQPAREHPVMTEVQTQRQMK